MKRKDLAIYQDEELMNVLWLAAQREANEDYSAELDYAEWYALGYDDSALDQIFWDEDLNKAVVEKKWKTVMDIMVDGIVSEYNKEIIPLVKAKLLKLAKDGSNDDWRFHRSDVRSLEAMTWLGRVAGELG